MARTVLKHLNIGAIMAISSVSNTSLQSIASEPKQDYGKYSTRILNGAQKLIKLALPLIFMANLPGVSAGPITYAACMAGLTAGTAGAGAPLAWATCLPFLGPWCP